MIIIILHSWCRALLSRSFVLGGSNLSWCWPIITTSRFVTPVSAMQCLAEICWMRHYCGRTLKISDFGQCLQICMWQAIISEQLLQQTWTCASGHACLELLLVRYCSKHISAWGTIGDPSGDRKCKKLDFKELLCQNVRLHFFRHTILLDRTLPVFLEDWFYFCFLIVDHFDLRVLRIHARGYWLPSLWIWDLGSHPVAMIGTWSFFLVDTAVALVGNSFAREQSIFGEYVRLAYQYCRCEFCELFLLHSITLESWKLLSCNRSSLPTISWSYYFHARFWERLFISCVV